MSRRAVMGGAAWSALAMLVQSAGARPGWAQGASDAGGDVSGDDGAPFSANTVVEEARAAAETEHDRGPRAPRILRRLDYDAYRAIRFRKERAVWGRAQTPFSVELFAPGSIYRRGVEVFIVEGGRARPLALTADMFDAPSAEIAEALAEAGLLSGFRLHHPINRPDYEDEFFVFQGASYFRAVSSDQLYGLSARGLAVDVAEATGEEFPTFRRFWIERPSARASAIVVHALLDSPRVTGAYRFGIYPGAPTVVDVQATLFARERLEHVGVAPLTSMYFFGPMDQPDQPDYRPAVHDSLGLAMRTGRGERLWRPLSNPRTLQVSAFVDTNPKGFGLIQRDRDFDTYQDLEARYERRPSAWVSPFGDWGEGHVQLVEIPTTSEGNDNIVAYWRPRAGLTPGEPLTLSYRLSWPDDIAPGSLAFVERSAYGLTLTGEDHQMAIDYGFSSQLAAYGADLSEVSLEATASTGVVKETVVQPRAEGGGFRAFVTFNPEGAPMTEIRVQPAKNGAPIGETWLFRWLER